MGLVNTSTQARKWCVRASSFHSSKNGMASITRLSSRNDIARTVAAAGFMLKHENMNERLSMVQALTASITCASA